MLLIGYHYRNEILIVHNKIMVSDNLFVKGTEIDQNGAYLWLRLIYFALLNAGSFGWFFSVICSMRFGSTAVPCGSNRCWWSARNSLSVTFGIMFYNCTSRKTEIKLSCIHSKEKRRLLFLQTVQWNDMVDKIKKNKMFTDHVSHIKRPLFWPSVMH